MYQIEGTTAVQETRTSSEATAIGRAVLLAMGNGEYATVAKYEYHPSDGKQRLYYIQNDGDHISVSRVPDVAQRSAYNTQWAWARARGAKYLDSLAEIGADEMP